MKGALKIGGGLLLAAVCVFAGAFGSSIITADNAAPPAQPKAGAVWAERPASANRLPALKAPEDRTDPQLEADTARLCSQYAVFSGKMLFSARSKGMTRLQMQNELAGGKSEIADKITRHVADVIYSKEYAFSTTELANYTYQYCDLTLHSFVRNASETGGNDTLNLN